MMMISLLTTPRIYQSDGMASQFHTGYTSFMVLEKNSNAKYVEESATGVESHFKSISSSGVMHTE